MRLIRSKLPLFVFEALGSIKSVLPMSRCICAGEKCVCAGKTEAANNFENAKAQRRTRGGLKSVPWRGVILTCAVAGNVIVA